MRTDSIFSQLFQLLPGALFDRIGQPDELEELKKMFGLSEWKKTRFYQEVKEEVELKTKLDTVPELLKLGLSLEQIAKALKLSLEEVRQAAQEPSSN